MENLKQTPLCNVHKEMGARMVEFGGWLMPVQYTTVIDEHITTRTKAGLFDICHMGEITVKGKDALKFLQSVTTNDLSKIKDGHTQYSCMCYDNGGTVDDLFVYRFNQDHFMIVVNAGNIEKDFRWLNNHKADFDIILEDSSDNTGKIDIQGPLAEQVLQKLTEYDLKGIKRFWFIESMVADIPAIISRTGYTAEDGFEIYYPAENSEKVWKSLLEAGKEEGIKPIGLGARDTLRLEACYSLYGHELTKDISPVEAGIGFVVKEKEEDYVGKNILLDQKKNGTARKNVAIEMVDKSVPRDGYKVVAENKEIGYITSGTFSPTFKNGIALALIEFAKIDRDIYVMIRDKLYKAKIIKKPFYAYNG